MPVVSDIKIIKNKRESRKEGFVMAYIPVEYPAEKGAFYALLKEQLEKYTENETDETAILANASAVLGIALKDINWVGFYMVKGEELVLGPFQGKPAVSRIGYGEGGLRHRLGGKTHTAGSRCALLRRTYCL